MRKTYRSPKPFLLIVAVALVLLLAGLFIYKNRSSTTPNQTGPTAEQKKQEADTNAESKKQAIEKGNTNPGSSTPPATGSSDNITLTARQESDGNVTVFTKLKNISSGTCELTVTNGSKKTTQTAEVIYQPEYSSCAGFSVPVSSVGTGTWAIQLTVNYNGQSMSKSITYEVK